MNGLKRQALLLLCLAPSGCEAPPEQTSISEDLPSTYTPVLDTGAAEPQDLDMLEDATQDMIDGLRTMAATPVFEAFETALTWGNESCPDYRYLDDDAVYFDGSCETESQGTSFRGDAFYASVEYEEDEATCKATQLFAKLRVEQSEGAVFWSAGTAEETWCLGADGSATAVSRLLGLHFADATEVVDSWLATGEENDLNLDFQTLEDGRPKKLAISGGLGLAGDEYPSAYIEALQFGSEAGAWGCPGEPVATIWMRHHDGQWAVITMDMTDTRGTAPEDLSVCDGCGTVTVGDEALGQVCLDFSSLLDWEGAPW